MSAPSDSLTRMHVGDRVSRSYSTQAKVSTRTTYAPTHLVEIAVPTGPAHSAGFIEAQWLRCQRAQGEIDGFPLGRQAVLPHDRCTGSVVDIHVGARHTPMMHDDRARCLHAATIPVAFCCCHIGSAGTPYAAGLGYANTAARRGATFLLCERSQGLAGSDLVELALRRPGAGDAARPNLNPESLDQECCVRPKLHCPLFEGSAGSLKGAGSCS